MTIQDFLPWATLAAITIGIIWIVIQSISSKLSAEIEKVGKIGEANITRIEAAIQAGAKEHEQFRSDVKNINHRLDNLYTLLLDRLSTKDGNASQ
ncbi:MAG: hypothetical protein OXE81_05935 [Gammaproteobacteria bacterium]|nr:hypothetical protein [Gammaproteobacteria bacterium]